MERGTLGGRAIVPATDEALLASADPQDFGVFYARHLAAVESFFARRVGRQLAADLAAETFASALVARRRFVPGLTPATSWLYTIAARRLVDHQRRNGRERRLLDALTTEPTSCSALPPEMATDLEYGLLRNLPTEQRRAILAHVVEDREYRQIAADTDTTEATARQRVSRGLNALRTPLRAYRSALELARQDRSYRYGGGHGEPLATIGPREPLDCSSAASLILFESGLLEPQRAWNSARIASEWGSPGEGRYLTVWANDEHVWLEFRLESDHGERFDPTPSRLAPNAGWLTTTGGPTADFYPRHWPNL